MKTIRIIVTILSFAIFFACHKEEKYWPLGNYWKGEQREGKVHALRNGEFWEASVFATFYDHYPACSITFNTLDPIDTVITEDLGFDKVPFKEGLYSVHHLLKPVFDPIWVDSLRSYYSKAYDDLYGPAFFPDTTKNNWILIESVDSVERIIRGKFDVTYNISDAGAAETSYPRVVHFTKGAFEVKVRQ